MRNLERLIVALIVTAAPLMASPASELSGRDAARGYGYLLASTGFSSDVEHAAFLIRESGGAIRFVRWMSDEQNKARYRGKLPSGCIAIAHTHPRGFRDPSPHDIDEAKHLGVAIVVITTEAVTVALPDGTVQTLFEREEWSKLR